MDYYKDIANYYKLIKNLYNEISSDTLPNLENKIRLEQENNPKLPNVENLVLEFEEFLSELSYKNIIDESESIINNPVYKTLSNGDIDKQIKNLEAVKEKYYIDSDDCPYPFNSLEIVEIDEEPIRNIYGGAIKRPILTQVINNVLDVAKRDEIKRQKKIFKILRNIENEDKILNDERYTIYKIKEDYIDDEIKKLKMMQLIGDNNTLSDVLTILAENYSQLKNIENELNDYVIINPEDTEHTEDYIELKSMFYNMKSKS